MPRPLRLSRAAGWRLPWGARSVARPGLFGNPFSADALGREKAVEMHRRWITGEMTDAEIRASYTAAPAEQLIALRRQVRAALPELAGKDLACWCPLPEAGEPDVCHRAILLVLANPGADQ